MRLFSQITFEDCTKDNWSQKGWRLSTLFKIPLPVRSSHKCHFPLAGFTSWISTLKKPNHSISITFVLVSLAVGSCWCLRTGQQNAGSFCRKLQMVPLGPYEWGSGPDPQSSEERGILLDAENFHSEGFGGPVWNPSAVSGRSLGHGWGGVLEHSSLPSCCWPIGLLRPTRSLQSDVKKIIRSVSLQHTRTDESRQPCKRCSMASSWHFQEVQQFTHYSPFPPHPTWLWQLLPFFPLGFDSPGDHPLRCLLYGIECVCPIGQGAHTHRSRSRPVSPHRQFWRAPPELPENEHSQKHQHGPEFLTETSRSASTIFCGKTICLALHFFILVAKQFHLRNFPRLCEFSCLQTEEAVHTYSCFRLFSFGQMRWKPALGSLRSQVNCVIFLATSRSFSVSSRSHTVGQNLTFSVAVLQMPRLCWKRSSFLISVVVAKRRLSCCRASHVERQHFLT